MFVKKLKLQNFQVIENFDADFSGNVYFITGENELGKSTVLKAITALLTGNRDEVLRKGQDKGIAKMTVGGADGNEYEVELTFTKKNPRGTMKITKLSNGETTNNVSMLQSIFGYTEFDAVEFVRWSETAEGRRKQIECVKRLLPDAIRKRIAEIDADVSATKEERTEVNRDLKRLVALLNDAEKGIEPGDVERYKTPVDITNLMEQQAKNAQVIEKAKTVRAIHAQRVAQLAEIPARLAAAKDSYEKAVEAAKKAMEMAKKTYEETVKQIEAEKSDYERRKKNAEIWLADYEKENPEKMDIESQIRNADNHNKKYSAVQSYLRAKADKEAKEKEANEMDVKVKNLTAEREKLIANAKLPIPGLSFDETGLQLNGVQFVAGKVSDSQIMETAARLTIAINPTVKVLCVARGESLGTKRLNVLIDVAKKNGFQGFIEEVHRGQDELQIEEYDEE